MELFHTLKHILVIFHIKYVLCMLHYTVVNIEYIRFFLVYVNGV